MKVRKTTEDYLKTIYMLSMERDVHAYMIAERLNVSRPTVSVAMKRLEQEGYVQIDCHNVISITEKGLATAKPVYERFQTLREFLVRIGVREQSAFRDACEMEHILGEETYEAFKQLSLKLEADASGLKKSVQ